MVRERRPGEIAIDAVIREVSEREDVALIDTQPAFAAALAAAATPGAGLFLAAWHHPTPKGHRLIAETVFAAIRGAPRR